MMSATPSLTTSRAVSAGTGLSRSLHMQQHGDQQQIHSSLGASGGGGGGATPRSHFPQVQLRSGAGEAEAATGARYVFS
jgi:hypothetical protein